MAVQAGSLQAEVAGETVERGPEEPAATEPTAANAVPVDHGAGEEPHAGGAVREPAGHDPLGTGAEPGELADVQKDRAALAVSNFVISAYGYSGSDFEAYSAALARHSDPFALARSPGSAAVEAFGERVRSGGTSTTAHLEDFRFEKARTGGVEGTARFAAEGRELDGSYEQALRLEPWGATWRVVWAGELTKRRS